MAPSSTKRLHRQHGFAITRAILALLGIAALAAIAWLLFQPPEPGAGVAGPGMMGPRAVAREVGVVTAAVITMDFAQQIEALGTAQANESIEVSAEVASRVTEIRFKEGQQVNAGDILLTLEDSEARANLAEATAALVESRSQYQRSQELFATRAVSQSSLDQLAAQVQANEARAGAARSRLDDYVVRAPFAGRVGLRRVSPGGLVSPGQLVTTLDDTTTIKLDFSVPETFLGSIREGMEIVANSAAYPARAFAGRVASIDTRVDPVTRSVAVRARLPNDDGLLKPGMFLTVNLIQQQGQVVAVPEEALVPEQASQYVFVAANGVAERRRIVIGRRQPGFVEVLNGLRPGERVIVEGTQKVRDGTAIKDAPMGPVPEPGGT